LFHASELELIKEMGAALVALHPGLDTNRIFEVAQISSQTEILALKNASAADIRDICTLAGKTALGEVGGSLEASKPF